MRDHQDDFLPFLIDQQTGDCYSPGTVIIIVYTS